MNLRRLMQVLTDAERVIWQEQYALSDERHPRHKVLEKLLVRINREQDQIRREQMKATARRKKP